MLEKNPINYTINAFEITSGKLESGMDVNFIILQGFPSAVQKIETTDVFILSNFLKKVFVFEEKNTIFKYHDEYI